MEKDVKTVIQRRTAKIMPICFCKLTVVNRREIPEMQNTYRHRFKKNYFLKDFYIQVSQE